MKANQIGKLITDVIKDSIAIKEAFFLANMEGVANVAKIMTKAVKSGHKILLAGNGGSAADAQHLAAEFINRFTFDRGPMAAIAITTDTSVITGIANDSQFNYVFARQVCALGQEGDIFVGISTSGNSVNVLEAVRASKELGMVTVAFLGMGGGMIAKEADFPLVVESRSTPRIQEIHIILGHILCEIVEKEVFGHC